MYKDRKTILVTGGAGYIGSHTVKTLEQEGYQVIILDNLVYGHQDLVEGCLEAQLIVGDIKNRHLLDNVFSKYNIEAVIHFAAYAYVGESIVNPAKYYNNNVLGTLTLLEAMLAASVKKLVFSSTCATYGIPQQIPIPEDHSQNPINPYGNSKLMVEKILRDYSAAYNFNYVCFRYFNAAGAEPNCLLGEDHQPETHLIPLVLLAALGQRDSISVFGTDYPTPDGTCVRDYIHVSDLAIAHLLGLQYLLNGGKSEIFNLGNGNGFSVKEIIETARQITGKKIVIKNCDRRPGDPPALIGSYEKAKEILGWQPHFSDLKQIITHAWQWHQKRHTTNNSILKKAS
jgi:UDP-glucose 4-epimerase